MARKRLARLLTWIMFAFGLLFGLWTAAQDGAPPSLDRQLVQAVVRGQIGEVSALLTAGANPELPLRIAVMNGQAEIFTLLVDHGALLSGPSGAGAQALGMALYSSNKKVRERAAKDQAKRLAEGKMVFQNGGGYNEIIKVLLDHGVSADAPGEFGITPLMEATMCGNETAVSLLLDHGASVDAGMKDGDGTALYNAAWFGYGNIVELLLGAGASPDKANGINVTPLLAAACAGSAEASALALGGGAKGYEFMYGIRGEEYARSVQALLKAGADVNVACTREITPLMAASAAGSLEIVAALLVAGADPNLRDKDGRTALMFAAKTGQAPLVAALLSNGADPKAVALDGKTALSIAKTGKNQEAAKLLQKATAR